MTEAEWLAAKVPSPMLEFLKGKVNDRKLRLFALVCCQSVSHLIDEKRSMDALVLLQHVSDRLVGQRRLKAVRHLFAESPPFLTGMRGISLLAVSTLQAAIQPRSWNAAKESAVRAADTLSDCEIEGEDKSDLAIRRKKVAARRIVELTQAELLRCIIGPLSFRPITLDLSWHTSTVLALATGIYDERAFDRLPILADALQDAGCDSEEILSHLRQPGEHCRGCWALDLVLAKS